MQQVSDKSRCIPLLRHHSVSYLGEHGRHQTKKIIQEAIKQIEFNQSSKDKSFSVIFHALDQYPSNHGLEGELITEVYSLCLAKIVEQFQLSEYNPISKEFQISCDIVNLITAKFYDKISIKSEVLEQHFVYFSEMITEYNQIHFGKSDNIHAREQIHETFFRIVGFHIDASVRRDDFSSISHHHNFPEILVKYQDFIYSKIHVKDAESKERFSKIFHLIFNGLIYFVNSFKNDIHKDKKLFSEIVHFIHVLVNQFQNCIPSDFQSQIDAIVDSSLCMEFKTNYCLVKNIYVAQNFLKFIHEKEAFLLVKMEQAILSTSRLEHCRMPDFNEFILVYQYLFKKCPEEFQIQSMERIFKHSENLKAFYFLLESVLDRGIKFSTVAYKERYILILKNFIAKLKPHFLAHTIKSKDLYFDILLKIILKILYACQHFKSEDSPSVNSLCHWMIDLLKIILIDSEIDLDRRNFILKNLIDFVHSCSNDLLKLDKLKMYRLKCFSIENQTKSELFYELTKVTSNVLFAR